MIQSITPPDFSYTIREIVPITNKTDNNVVMHCMRVMNGLKVNHHFVMTLEKLFESMNAESCPRQSNSF